MEGKHQLRYRCEKRHWNHSVRPERNLDVHQRVVVTVHMTELVIIPESQDGVPLSYHSIGS